MKVKHLLIIIWILLLIWSGFYVDFPKRTGFSFVWSVSALLSFSLLVSKILMSFFDGKFDEFLNKKL